MRGWGRGAGLTLVEVVTASVVMGVLIALVYVILFRSSERYATESLQLALDARARETLAWIAKDLREAGPGTLRGGDPPADAEENRAYADFRFGVISRYDLAGREAKFEDRVRYRWAADPSDPVNGLDDDGNGRVDEGWVERTDPWGTVSRICGDVKPGGLRFVRSGRRVTVTLELERVDAKGARVARSASTSLELRN